MKNNFIILAEPRSGSGHLYNFINKIEYIDVNIKNDFNILELMNVLKLKIKKIFY